MIHQGTLDQSPAMLAQHAARKARLARFAQAAVRQEEKDRAAADIEQLAVLERTIAAQPAPPARREYQTAARPARYVSLTGRILIAVANEFGMAVSDMLARSNHPKFSVPRFVAIGLLLELTRLSLPAIGQRLGQRDHSTIVNGRKRIRTLLLDQVFKNRYEQIKAECAGVSR